MRLALRSLSAGAVLAAVRIIVEEARCLGVLTGTQGRSVKSGAEGSVVPHTELLRRPSPRQEEQMPIDWNVGGEINGRWRFCFRFLKVRGGWKESTHRAAETAWRLALTISRSSIPSFSHLIPSTRIIQELDVLSRLDRDHA